MGRMSNMNKSEFIKELTEKLNYNEEKCIIIKSGN